ncbi:hypothetical protein EGT74_09050 [Chitinophaga lutea]|uniref:Uncharacterized protein n=1 Tax=Chitinophaga lutea TaxID=2488634 RepID=A0A3N4PXU2_9BACT|nr:hypothetical protein EGT74_09050 [Chitinophaga lutea]
MRNDIHFTHTETHLRKRSSLDTFPRRLVDSPFIKKSQVNSVFHSKTSLSQSIQKTNFIIYIKMINKKIYRSNNKTIYLKGKKKAARKQLPPIRFFLSELL